MVRKKKELEETTAFQIREEFVRWDNVKTAHDLMDDMGVARMLLDCYDLIGGNLLVWSDQAKLAPPPLYATLRLQHVTPEGWEILQEIKTLGGWMQDKAPKGKKSRRKQAQVQRIPIKEEEEEVEIDFDTYGLNFNDPKDEDYDPEEEDIDTEDLKDEDYEPEKDFDSEDDNDEKVTKLSRSKRLTRQVRRKDCESSDLSDSEASETPNKKEGNKKKNQSKGRPTKGNSVSQKATPMNRRKKSGSTRKQPKKNWGRYAKASEVFECNHCLMRVDELSELKDHYNRSHKEGSTKNTEETNKSSEESESMKPSEDSESMKPSEESESLKPSEDSESMKQKQVQINRPFQQKKDATLLFRCLACNEIMKNKDDHRKLHDRNKRPMVCHVCGSVLNSVDTYRIHMSMHDARARGVQIECKICGKSFPKSGLLRAHLRFHSKARPHQCETCGKGFKTAAHLSRHKLIHVEAKPLICSYCGKGFNNKSNFRGHVRIHTGEKPYKCDSCPMAFTHNVSLKSHKKSAHGIDMWKIPVKRAVEVDDETIKTSVIASLAEKTEGKPDSDEMENKVMAATETLKQEKTYHGGGLQEAGATLGTDMKPTVVNQEMEKEVMSLTGLSQYQASKPTELVTQAESNLTPHSEKKVICYSQPSFILPGSEQHQSGSIIIPPYPPVHPQHQIPTAPAGDYLNIPIHSKGPPFNINVPTCTSETQSAHHQEFWDASKRTFTKL